jgi:hypothetical protein
MSELREGVPGDAGYDVERFAEKKCGSCVHDGGCLATNGWSCNYQPKSASPIGETVLTDIICDTCQEHCFDNFPSECVRKQDAHTRKGFALREAEWLEKWWQVKPTGECTGTCKEMDTHIAVLKAEASGGTGPGVANAFSQGKDGQGCVRK